MGAISKAIRPLGFADRLLPALSHNTPMKPMARPTHSRRLGYWPRIAENRPIHSGVDATATAARPEDTHCSAMLTMPLPSTISSTPMNTRSFHCARVGAGTPRQRSTAYISTPATRKRPPAMRNGGKPPSSAKWMPR